jgi:hypothetical protein
MIGRIVIVIETETEIVIEKEKEKRIDQTVRVAKRNATVAETNRRAEAQKETESQEELEAAAKIENQIIKDIDQNRGQEVVM